MFALSWFRDIVGGNGTVDRVITVLVASFREHHAFLFKHYPIAHEEEELQAQYSTPHPPEHNSSSSLTCPKSQAHIYRINSSKQPTPPSAFPNARPKPSTLPGNLVFHPRSPPVSTTAQSPRHRRQTRHQSATYSRRSPHPGPYPTVSAFRHVDRIGGLSVRGLTRSPPRSLQA